MSIVAMNWALQQRLPTTAHQVILYVIADSADPDGVTQHCKPDYLGPRARVSRPNLFRKMRDLEEYGLLARRKYYDEHGRACYEIRLNFGAVVDIPIYSRSSADHEDGDAADASEQLNETPESHRETLVSADQSLTQEEPKSHCGDCISPPVSKNPPQPPLGGSRSAAQDQQSERCAAAWARFREHYPGIGTMDQDAAREEFDRLSADDAEWAAEALGHYRAEIAKLKKPPKNAHLWLRKGMFRNYARGAKPSGDAEAPELPWITDGSDTDLVVTWLYRRAGVPRPFVVVGQDGKRGYRARRPIGPDALAMTAHVDDRIWRMQSSEEAGPLRPPQRVWLWPFYPQGSAEFAAWQRRFREWTGSGLPIETDETGRQGIRAPRPWPPRKDGTWTSDGTDEPDGGEGHEHDVIGESGRG